MTNVVPIKTTASLPPDNLEVPDFITRADISKYTDVQLDDMLEAIRLRRTTSYIITKRTQSDLAAGLADTEKAAVAADKKATQIIKTLATLDANFEKLERQVNELRGLRIQAGLEIV